MAHNMLSAQQHEALTKEKVSSKRTATTNETTKQRSHAASKRTKSSNARLVNINSNTSAVTMANDWWKQMIRALQGYQLPTDTTVRSHFQWLLPKFSNTAEQLEVYHSFIQSPMTVSNVDLAKIFQIVQSTEESLVRKPGHHFYLRSWPLREDELELLMSYLSMDDSPLVETQYWKGMIRLYGGHPSGLSYYWLRYLGLVEGPRRQFDRFLQDFQGRTSGVMEEVQRAIEMLLPDVSDACEVFHITAASVDPLEDWGQAIADSTERLLIAAFDHPTLLNRQRGGLYMSYVSPQVDVTNFERLNTRFYNHFLQHANLPSSQLSLKVAKHFNAIQEYANAHPAETGTFAHPFTDGLKDAMREQATPSQYRGHTLVVFFGKDITLEDYLGEKLFIKGKSRAGLLTRDFLCRLAATEEINHGQYWEDGAFNPFFFTFFDLWCWLKHLKTEATREFARSLMAILRPVIVNTLSAPVTSITYANFRSDSGLPSQNRFSSIAGNITIQYYSEATDSGDVNDDDAFINIAHIDPGVDKYGGAIQDLELRRVLDICTQKAVLVADVAMRVLDENSDAGVAMTRKELCQTIVGRVDAVLQDTSAGRDFAAGLESARIALRSAWSRQRMRLEFEDRRPLLNAEGRKQIADFGQAEGEPDSKERHAQLSTLWNRNIADLHLAIPHEPHCRDAWVNSFLPLERGQFFYLQVISILPVDEYTATLLSQFRPRRSEESEDYALLDNPYAWLDNPNDIREAVQNCGLRIKQKEKEGGSTRQGPLSPREAVGTSQNSAVNSP